MKNMQNKFLTSEKLRKKREYNRIWMKNWTKNNPDKVLERRKKQYLRLKTNKELWDKEMERQRKYRIENRDVVRMVSRNHRKRNLEKIRKYYRDYRKKDIVGQIATRLYSRLHGALKAKNIHKCYKTTDLVGCSVGDLRKYLESKFKKGMSWDNRGEFHIDHIIPLSKFDLTDPEQQKKAFHYTNLQPLWAFENLSKGTKII